MLWKKEAIDANSMYVDLFESISNREWLKEIHTQMLLGLVDAKSKNNLIADEYRRNGNDKFAEKNYFDALKLYNKSLCYAENESENIGFAYANRARCYLLMGMYEKCLIDLRLAKQNNYPEHMMYKLQYREQMCMEAQKSNEGDTSEKSDQKLDYQANEKFPCLANVVKIQNNSQYGRHLVATEDIEVGNTVMVEQCYFGEIVKNPYDSCNICLKRNGNFIPCKTCANAMFCSDCVNNDFHQIECEINSKYPGCLRSSIIIRSILMAKLAFADADQLISFMEAAWNCDSLEMPVTLSHSQSKYRAFFQLCNDSHKKAMDLQLIYAIQQLLLEQRDMAAYFHTEGHKRFLAHLIHHHSMVIRAAAQTLRTKPTGSENIASVYINIVAFYLNHSCVPNIGLKIKNGLISCVAIRPILKNEQLFISYVFGIFKTEMERQNILRQRLNFQCKCEVCEFKSFPTNSQMRIDPNFRVIRIVEPLFFRLNGLKIDFIKKKCFAFLNKFGRSQWTLELGFVLQVLSVLLISEP